VNHRIFRQGSSGRMLSVATGARRFLGKEADYLLWRISGNSAVFWDRHYRIGGSSGPGSIGELRTYKAMFVNEFVVRYDIQRIVEFGCGNGDQLQEARYPEYVGLDVSEAIVKQVSSRYEDDKSKSFFVYRPNGFLDNLGLFRAQLTLSMDVIFHLVEEDNYRKYLGHLFSASTRWVIIYSSNINQSSTDVPYTRHRRFTDDVEQVGGWHLVLVEDNPLSHLTRSQFFVFERDNIL